MSQENVEIVRKTIEARNRDLDEWLSFFHPAARTSDRITAAGMSSETQGLDQLRRGAEEWMEMFEDYQMDVVELLDLDDELVLAEVRFKGRGAESGAEVTLLQVDLYRVHEGLITEQSSGYRSREDALEAAGFEPADD
jgi:SnoaL-like domain